MLQVDTANLGVNTISTLPDPSRWLTQAQLAQHLRVSQRHLHNIRLAGLPHILLGSSVRFDLGEVEAFLRSRRRISTNVQVQQPDAITVGQAAKRGAR